MRARVVRTAKRVRVSRVLSFTKGCLHWQHTLRDIDVGARKAIGGQKACVHVDAVLCHGQRHCSPGVKGSSRSVLHTESSTLLRALSSASVFSFLCCSSANERCAAPPLVALAVVGPDGTVGAWRLFILSGKPIAVKSRKLLGVPFSRRQVRRDSRC